MHILFRYSLILIFSLSLFSGLSAQEDMRKPELRSFDIEKLDRYVSDPMYSYSERHRAAQKAQEVEDAFWANVERFFSKNRIGSVNLTEMILALVVVFTVFFVALSLLGVNVRSLFKRRAQEIPLHDEELAEDLRELDFDQLLAHAKGQQDYRRGVRLLYLETLNMLGEKNLIQFARHKTNYEYLLSLQGHRLYDDFERLTLQFDYVWYGNFDIDEAGFDRMTNTFRHFQSNLNIKTKIPQAS
ncbi:MAG: DUF4129 domain-containing protein [Bacteroidia bacterium]